MTDSAKPHEDEIQPGQPEVKPEAPADHALVCQTRSGHAVPDGCTYGDPADQAQ